MAKNKENEAVVNRFLFSTLYVIVLELFVYYTYSMGVSMKYILWYQNVFNITLACLAVVLVLLGIYAFAFKKVSKYQFFAFLVMFLVVLFLRFSVYIPVLIPSLQIMGMTKNRHIVAAFIGLVAYLYELIRYFIKNR